MRWQNHINSLKPLVRTSDNNKLLQNKPKNTCFRLSISKLKMCKALFVDNKNTYYNEKDLNFPDRRTNYKIEREKEIPAVFTEFDML